MKPLKPRIPQTSQEAIATASERIKEAYPTFDPSGMDLIWVQIDADRFSVELYEVAWQFLPVDSAAHYFARFSRTDQLDDLGTITLRPQSNRDDASEEDEGGTKFYRPDAAALEAIEFVRTAIEATGEPLGATVWIIRDGPGEYSIKQHVELAVGFWVVDKATGEARNVGHGHQRAPRHRGQLVEST